jgi:nitroimidazol reductase NimA-like FMN-containing flavoprotein (pyridoxamine 5'-phosphate oxidase superfamily)
MEPALTAALPDPGSTDRTRIRRLSERAVTDRVALHAVLDAGLVAHVAVVDDEGQPYVIPVAYARLGDEVIFHGSSGSRLFRNLAAGQPTCLTVTLLDGLVLARSAFESSMNYRSAVILGVTRRLVEDEELDALRAISDHLLPGRWDDIRPPTAKERAATITLALSLAECSVKISAGGPEDLPEDVADPVFGRIWAGHVPIVETFGDAIPCPTTSPGMPVPPYIGDWKRT